MSALTRLTNIARSEGDPKVVQSGNSSLTTPDKVARALGWFSIALGVTELVAPARVTRALGLTGSEGMVRAFGAREIVSGVLSLSVDKQVGLWSRVAGDGLDMAVVLGALSPANPQRENVKRAAVFLAGVMLVDVLAARAVTRQHARSGHGTRRSDVQPRRDYGSRSGFPNGIEA